MISRLDNGTIHIGKAIRTVFQVSYAIEAKLLNAVDFPPLQRTLDEFLNSKNAFYGYWKKEELAAVIEILERDKSIHIQSLVVHPDYFRQGIASTLLRSVLDRYDSKLITVETGLANAPATELYKAFDFKETRTWDTDHGVRKIAFELLR